MIYRCIATILSEPLQPRLGPFLYFFSLVEGQAAHRTPSLQGNYASAQCTCEISPLLADRALVLVTGDHENWYCWALGRLERGSAQINSHTFHVAMAVLGVS
jgi:hypothetical protein